jgi:hypothetical protein
MSLIESQFNAATRALALRWIRMARDSLESKFRAKSENCREEITTTLVEMPEEEDWYYGAAMRLQGADLLVQGSAIDDDRRVMEAEAAVKIHKIESDLRQHTSVQQEELDNERKAFEVKLAQQNDRITLDIEIRTAELERLKASKQVEFAEIERKAKMESGAASTELTQSHRNQLIDIDNMIDSDRTNAERTRDEDEREARIMFDRQEAIKIADINRRTTMAKDSIARIREEVAMKVRNAETDWQVQCVKWLTVAKKKVQVKKREDQEARKNKQRRRGEP